MVSHPLLDDTRGELMADRTIAIAFAPPGARVGIHVFADPDTWQTATDTNFDGYVPQQVDDSLGDSDIRIEADGFRPYQVHFKFKNSRDNASDPRPLNQQVNVGLDIPALVPVAPPLPPPETLPSLTIIGRDFFDNGVRTALIGCDQFLAYRQFLSGMDLTPLYAESRQLGFNLWRVFLQGSIAQNGVLELRPSEPGYYEHIRPFVEQVNSQGIVPLLTIGVDNQDVGSTPAHWQRVYDETDGTTRIISKANEWSKNLAGLTPAAFPNPTQDPWSQGSDVQDVAPFRPQGSVFEFHPVRRFTTAMRDSVASPIELFEVQGYSGVMILDEPGRMGVVDPSPSEFASPKHCYEYARLCSTLCGVVVFHNRAGQSGRLMEPGTRECAAAFVEGMRL